MKKSQTALVREAVRGNKQAFTELIEELGQTMYATAMAVTRNEQNAMDAVQETVLILWEKLDTLKKPQYFKTWMTRILVNNCCLFLRRESREAPAEWLPETGREGDLDTPLDVQAALQRLSQDDRLILQLFYFEDLSTREIAQVLNLSPQAVRMRLSRGRKRFAEKYKAEVRYEQK